MISMTVARLVGIDDDDTGASSGHPEVGSVGMSVGYYGYGVVMYILMDVDGLCIGDVLP